ncbi:MAG: hypothetical protein ACE5Q6_03845 [Dehalococcoidia bacterium]
MPGLQRKVAHTPHIFGYEWAVSDEYQMLLIEFFAIDRDQWLDEINTLSAYLNFPRHDERTESYQGMVLFYQAIKEAVSKSAPLLIQALTPFLKTHGLDALPWGAGWVCEQLAGGQGPTWDIDLSHLPDAPTSRHFTDWRVNPFEDSLLVYLHLTGCWRDRDVQEILDPLLEFVQKEALAKKKEAPANWPDYMALRGERIKRTLSKLGVHRPQGRPNGRSKRDDFQENLRVLSLSIEYLISGYCWHYSKESKR